MKIRQKSPSKKVSGKTSVAKKETGKPKKKLDDAKFLERYFALGENGSALARELKISPPAITKRLKKIGKEAIDQARALGIAAGVLAPSMQLGKKPGNQLALFVRGAEKVGGDQFRIFDRLGEYLGCTDAVLAQLQTEINEHMSSRAGAKLKPYHIDLLCKVVSQGRSLAESVHKVRKDILDIKGTMGFFEAVTRVLERQIPDVQDQLYAELSRLGAYGAADLLLAAEDTEAEAASADIQPAGPGEELP